MKIFSSKRFLEHNTDSIVEGPKRLEVLLDTGAYIDFNVYSDSLLELIHTRDYVDRIRRACYSRQTLAQVQLTPTSFEVACLAVSTSVEAAQQSGFAAVRPPGHHARVEKAAGFCLFNNIAIAVQTLLNQGKRVAILDIDGHHGDGTQSIFDGNEHVLYCSIHQEVHFMDTGKTSTPNCFNLLLKPPIDEGIYLDCTEKCLRQMIAFSPDVVAVSAGFDTFKEDTLLDFSLHIETYQQIGLELALSFDNVFAVLEGGYHNKVMECIVSFVSGVNSVYTRKVTGF